MGHLSKLHDCSSMSMSAFIRLLHIFDFCGFKTSDTHQSARCAPKEPRSCLLLAIRQLPVAPRACLSPVCFLEDAFCISFRPSLFCCGLLDRSHASGRLPTTHTSQRANQLGAAALFAVAETYELALARALSEVGVDELNDEFL